MYQYDTVSEAITGLKERGYTEDFNLQHDCIRCAQLELHPSDFDITEVYRFEGDSDPADEAIVYGIESDSGIKGVLVNGYGYSQETVNSALAEKLSVHLHK